MTIEQAVDQAVDHTGNEDPKPVEPGHHQADHFTPWQPLIEGVADPACHAVIIIPARNEEDSLAATLDAFATQVDLSGRPLPQDSFEILLLLNNCTDASAHVTAQWQRTHPQVRLHAIERNFAPDQAFVGTARRMLMDTAWQRLQGRLGLCGILSTDSDTVVRNDWIARNLAALNAGADAIGGIILLKPGELNTLPRKVRRAYLRDQRYQTLVAQLEDRLDPQQSDPWPRHLQHFGASLACTPQIYASAGGMPAVTPLEDVAFVGRLRHIGARLRHHPEVIVYTSSRMKGRVDVGLSGQLSIWEQQEDGQHRVQSASWLAHRFRTLSSLRKEAEAKGRVIVDYLAEVDCDRIVAETFSGDREEEITVANRSLNALLTEAIRP